MYAWLAQLVERDPYTVDVGGSSPSPGTIPGPAPKVTSNTFYCIDQQLNFSYNSGIVLQRIDMNDWDRNNLHFILDSDEATLEDFYSWATEDDLVYALNLVRTAVAELIVQEAELMDEVEDFAEARSVLTQFQL